MMFQIDDYDKTKGKLFGSMRKKIWAPKSKMNFEYTHQMEMKIGHHFRNDKNQFQYFKLNWTNALGMNVELKNGKIWKLNAYKSQP